MRAILSDQLAEASRLDSKARELIGYAGLVLALLAGAITQAGGRTGIEALTFGVGSTLAVLLLALAAGFAIMAVAAASDDGDRYLTLGPGTARQLVESPDTLASEPWVTQVSELFSIVDWTAHNAEVLKGTRLRVSQAYGLFAAGLGSTVVAIVALIPDAL